MYILVFHVPLSDSEKVKESVFKEGAGRMGNYEACSFDVEGKGQFRPLKGANPHIDSVDKLEIVDELRVETTVQDKDVERVIEALKRSHPYEEPSYHLIKVGS